MKTTRLNGILMNTPEIAHAYLKRRLRLPGYYGHNLDALWDILSTDSRPRQVQLINRDAMLAALGQYGRSLIGVFVEAAAVNPRLTLIGRGFAPAE